MAGFDTSDVAAHVGQGNAFNPLQTIEGLAATRNLLNQNRLFQAQQAGGNAFLGALGPNGAIDPAALRNNLMRDPNAGLVAPDMAQAGATLAGAQLGQAGTRVGTLRSTMASVAPPLMDKNHVPLPGEMDKFHDRYMATLNSGVQQGLWSAADAANVAGGNVAGLSPLDVVRQSALQAGNPTQVEQQVGHATLTDTGGILTPTRTTIGPEGETVAPIEATPSIVKSIAPTIVSAQTGRGTVFTGVTPVTGQVRELLNVPNAATANAPAYEQYNPVTRQMETVTVAQAAANPPSGPIGNAPPLGTREAAAAASAATGSQSGGYFAGIQGAAAQAPAQQASLSELSSLLTDPKVQTGPGSPFLSKLNGLAQQFGVPVDPKWADDTSKLDVFNKVATQIAQQQFGVIGGTGTDAKLMSAAHTSPDQMISSISNKDIIPLLKGNAAAAQHIAAAANAWLGAGHDNTTGPAFQATLVQHHYNPLVFQTQFMDPAERNKIISGLDKADQAKYQADYIYALKKRWVKP